MRRAAAGIHITGIRASRASRSIAAEKETLHFPLELQDGRIEGFASRIDHNRPLRAQTMEMESYGLPDAAPDAVAHHCFTDGAGQGEADVGTIRLRLADAECGQQGAGKTGP